MFELKTIKLIFGNPIKAAFRPKLLKQRTWKEQERDDPFAKADYGRILP